MSNPSKQPGFSLIEIMVALSIFSIVALVAVSSLLIANRTNQKAQAMKVAVDNLHFALNSMTFKMRQGGTYHCFTTVPSSPGYYDSGLECLPASGGGQAISFITPKYGVEASEQRHVIYRYNSENHAIEYWNEDFEEDDFVPITSSDLEINDLRFYVFNINSGNPRVFISVSGQAQTGHMTAPFELETVVSER